MIQLKNFIKKSAIYFPKLLQYLYFALNNLALNYTYMYYLLTNRMIDDSHLTAGP